MEVAILKKKTLLLSLVLCLLVSFSVTAAADDLQLKIFHTNDTHARVEAGKYAGMGFAKISSLVKEARNESDNVFVIDAGDAFHGQIIANLVEGKSIAQIYNAIGYDVMTPGNHDFNYGVKRLKELNEMTDFPVIAANITNKDDTQDYPFPPGEIKTIDGVKIAFIGLATPETAYKTHPKNVQGITFQDPVQSAQKMVDRLQKQENPDIIIAVSHLGLSEGSKYTSADVAKKVDAINLIIDGHSHHTLKEGRVINDTPIVMAGEHTKNLGVVNLTIENKKLVNSEANLITKKEAADVKPDPEITKLVQEIKQEQDKITSEVIGKTAVELNGARANIRTGETNLGNLVADAMLSAADADVALTNSGGIRDSIAQGEITKGDIIRVLPFGNYVVVKKMKGKTLMEAVEHGLTQYPAHEGLFPQVGNMSIVFNRSKPAGDRGMFLHANGEFVKPNKYYRVATNDFMAAGGDGYDMLKNTETVQEADGLAEVVIDYIQDKGTIAPTQDGRILSVAKDNNHYIYKVEAGDTLSEISNWFGVEMSKIIKLNNIENPNLVYPDTKIKLPPAQ